MIITLIMYIHIKVKTKQTKEIVLQKDPQHFEISLKEEAKQNRANERILEIVRKHFNNKNVRIINGHQSPSKLLAIGDT